MSFLSLDTSFQNPSQNRHGSLANLTSSINSSPKSNHHTLKPNSSTRSIEKINTNTNRSNSSSKKAPLAKTPQKYYKDNSSPLPLSKRSIPRNDQNPDFKRSIDSSTNRVSNRDTLKRSSSKPLTSISMCSSRVSANLAHSELRQSTFDKLNESIEALAKSALAENLYHANSKEVLPRGSQSSSRKPPTKSREPEVSSFSGSASKNTKTTSHYNLTLNSSGSKRNIVNSQNTSFVMQQVYSVNNKALNLTNLLTRPRSREDLSSRHTTLNSASRNPKDVKENNPKYTPVRQSLDGNHQIHSASKVNMQKRLSEPAVKSRGLEVRNLNTSNISRQTAETSLNQSQEIPKKIPYIPSSLVKNLIGSNNNEAEITKITEKDESSQLNINDTVSFGDCNNINHTQNDTLSNYVKTEIDDDQETALNSLKERFDVFVGTISTVIDEAAFREKRSFFIKLLTLVHTHKVKLSKFLAAQELNKKSFYFDLWYQSKEQNQTSIVCEKEAGIDQMLEEAQLSRAIAFHNTKLYKKYFYQGFLGHYVICKLGTQSQEEENQQQQLTVTETTPVKQLKSSSTKPISQDQRKRTPSNESRFASQRSKTPTNSQSLTIANFPVKQNPPRKLTPTDRSFRSQTCLTSPNQSFVKGTSNKYPPKNAKIGKSKEIMSASVLEQSFGCDNARNPCGKSYNLGEMLTKKTLDTEEIPDQVLTRIPQPQKKEGLETLPFDTPRRMNTRNNTLESTERSMKSGGSSAKPRVTSQNRVSGNSPSYQQGQKKKAPEMVPKASEKKEFNKVLKKKYEPHRRETETPPLQQKTRSNSNLRRTEERTVSSFNKVKTSYYDDDEFFEPSQASLQKALTFRKNKLTQLYGQNFLTILVTTTNRKIQAAWFLRIRNLLRKGLIGFMQALESKYESSEVIEEMNEQIEDDEHIQEEEEESENVKQMMEIAREHYETTVKINVFNNLLEYFVQSHEEGNMYAQYRDNFIKRSCFIKWFEVLPQLKEEEKEDDNDENFELAYEAIIKKFRFIMLAEKSMRQWRNYIAEGGKNQSNDQ